MAGEKFDPFPITAVAQPWSWSARSRCRAQVSVQTRSTGARPEECYEVQQDGNAVRMLINRSEAWYGTLAPLR
jgi:hypothetical protein